jgi:P-type conjugative transfer protein TrbJ
MLRLLRDRARLRRFLTIVLVLALAIVIAINGSKRLGAQIVFDPSNYSQNVLTAARSLEQINNQIRALENQAQMLINQAKNLTSLPTSIAGQLAADLQQIDSLISQAKDISFNVQKATSEFERLYPRQYSAGVSSDRMVQDATARWDNTYQAFRQTLLTQATIASAIDQDGQRLRTLMANSLGAVGALQAQQSTNELLALQVKQSLQAQTLAAMQARANALKSAEEQASAAAAQERFVRFIGDSRAYSVKK